MNTEPKTHWRCPDCGRTLSTEDWTYADLADRGIPICGDCDRDMELIQPAPEATQEILVIMEGALIQEIDGIPPGIVVRVKDYDVDGVDEDRLQQDEDGRRYIESVWAHEDSCGPAEEAD
jgi:hypothetical protein